LFRNEVLKRTQDYIDCVEDFAHGKIALVVEKALNERLSALDTLENDLSLALQVVGEKCAR